MLGRIIRKQFLEYLISLRFLVALILCLTVGVGATIVRTHAYGISLGDYRVNRVDHGREARTYSHPFPLTYSGVSLDKKPTALGIFYRGLEPSRPMSVRVTANRDPRTEDQFEQANLVADLFQTVDLMTFVALVMGLRALVFSYDLISGEKEAGTLRLTLSFSVPRDKLVIGKWLGGYLALAVPLVFTAICSLAVVVISPSVSLSRGEFVAFAVLVLAAMLYTGCFYSLGLMVSSMTTRAFTSITALIAVWVALTVGLPNVSPYLAHSLLPAPSIQEVEREKWAIGKAEDDNRRSRAREYRRTTTDPQKVRGAVSAEFWRESFANIARRQEEVQVSYERALDTQVSAAMWFSRLSPTASVIYASSEISGTGICDLRSFRKALQAYRMRFLNYCEDKWIVRINTDGGPISTSDYPRFSYIKAELGDRVGTALLDLGLLVVWNVIFFVTGYVGFLKYDVR